MKAVFPHKASTFCQAWVSLWAIFCHLFISADSSPALSICCIQSKFILLWQDESNNLLGENSRIFFLSLSEILHISLAWEKNKTKTNHKTNKLKTPTQPPPLPLLWCGSEFLVFKSSVNIRLISLYSGVFPSKTNRNKNTVRWLCRKPV